MISLSAKQHPRRKMNSNNVLLLITILLFAVMYIAGCIVYADKGFSHLQTFLNILISNSGLICVTCGMTCVLLAGGIDISVGALIAMDCMFLASGIENSGIPAQILMILVLLIGVAFGIVQGTCVGYLGIQPFIITMAGMFFARGMTAMINTQQVTIKSSEFFVNLANLKFYIPFNIGAYKSINGSLMVPYFRLPVIIALMVLVTTFLMLRYTKLGRSLYAVGGNQQSAALMGLNVRKTRLSAYVLSSLLCSIGGICYCLNTMCGTTTQAIGLEMDSISSAVIGGTLLTGGVGNVIGSFFGVLINGTISSLVKTNGKLVSSWSNVVTALLLCFFIILQAFFARLKVRSRK
jgi:simple sugar transport system permease protein